jgi:hypothetical protein
LLHDDPTFEDHENNSELHIAIIRDDFEKFDALILELDFIKS